MTEPAPASNSPPGPATPAPGETATSRPCHVHASRNSSSCDDDDGSECDSLEGSGCSSMGPSKDKQGGKEGGKDKEGRDKGSAKGGQPAPFGLERAREVVRQWKAQPNQRKALLHDAEQYNSQQTAGPPASLSRLLVAHLQYLGAGSGPKATGRSTAEELQKVMSSLRGWDNTALGCPRSLMSYCLYVSAGLKGGGSVPELHALVQATVNDRERKFADEETWRCRTGQSGWAYIRQAATIACYSHLSCPLSISAHTRTRTCPHMHMPARTLTCPHSRTHVLAHITHTCTQLPGCMQA